MNYDGVDIQSLKFGTLTALGLRLQCGGNTSIGVY